MAVPLTFEPNVGQTDPLVRFLARGANYTFFVLDREAVVSLSGEQVIRLGSSAHARKQKTPIDQDLWVERALEMFGAVFGGATAYPKAKGTWRDDDREGALVWDERVVVHCYTTQEAIENSTNLERLGDFCRSMGRETNQGEVGFVIGDVYFAIQDFEE